MTRQTSGDDRPVGSGMSFVEVLEMTARWRRRLGWQWRRVLADVDAEIVAAVWEQYRAGCTDSEELHTRARVVVRRAARREISYLSRRVLTYETGGGRGWDGGVAGDGVDELVERLAADAVLAGLVIPPGAQGWAAAMAGGPRPARAEMVAGRRWANRARTRWEACHVAA